MTVKELTEVLQQAVAEGYGSYQVGGSVFNNFYDFRELFVTKAEDGVKLFVFELDIEVDA